MTRHTKPNEWEKRFGAIRRAKDRALLEEVERQIAIEEAAERAFNPIFGEPTREPPNLADDSELSHSGRPFSEKL